MDVTISTQSPYSYAVLDNIFPIEKLTAFLEYLSNNSNWFLHKQNFFEVYELNLDELETSQKKQTSWDYSWVKSNVVIQQLKEFLEHEFNVLLDDKCSICVNRLIQGQSIGVHNDAPRIGFATHRFVVNLNANYQDTDGGHFYVLKRTGEKTDIEKIIRPIINTGFAFESSPSSYHAVGKVKDGTRYSLIFTFWHIGNKLSLKEQLGTRINILKGKALENPSQLLLKCLEKSRSLDLQSTEYCNSSYFDYVLDTYVILKDWELSEEICVNGFIRKFIEDDGFCDIVGQATLSLAKYLDDYIHYIPESLDTQPALIKTLYFAHVIVKKRISFFSVEGWEKDALFLKGIRNSLPLKAQKLYDLIY